MEPHPILDATKQFAQRLEYCAEVERFRLAERQVNQSKRVQELIELIKKKQKELVHAKHYQKTEYIQLLEKELDELNHTLDHLPIVREYQQTQVDMNDLLQTIQSVLADVVSQRIEVEIGGEVSGGCGSGGACGCKK